MIQAIIFDMDGVLVDSEEYHLQIESEVMRNFGVELTTEVFKEYAGSRFEEEFEALLQRFAVKASLQEIMEFHKKIAEKYYAEVFPAMPSAKETLEVLHQEYPLALVTGSHKNLARETLKRLKLLEYFHESIFMEDVTKGKPHPEGFLLAAKKLKVAPAKIIVIEDSIRGFAAAKKAGMKLIGYKSHHNATQDFSLADVMCENLQELPAIIKTLHKV